MNTEKNDRAALRIDIHVHVVALDPANGCFVSKRLQRHPVFIAWRGLKGYLGLSPAEADRRYLADLAADVRGGEGIDKAVILAFDAVHDEAGRRDEARTRACVPNEYILAAAREYPDVFLPGVSVHPARLDALDEIDRLAELGAVLNKWVPSSQGIDPADAAYTRFYRKLAEKKLPLLTHTGYEHTVPAETQDWGSPNRLERALGEGVTVIAAHSGSSGIGHLVEYFPKYAALAAKWPNLYGDISAFTSVSRAAYLRPLLKNPLLVERSVQGSDYPIPAMPSLFVHRLGPREALEIARERNIFTRDYRIKKRLGAPEEVFYRAARVLNQRDSS